MAERPWLEISEDGDVTVVRFRDSHLFNLAEIEQVRKELRRLVEEDKHGRIVVDFSGVDYLSRRCLAS